MGVTEKAVLYSRSRFSWELSEIGAAKLDGARLLREAPAAFRRLCVETVVCTYKHKPKQPAAFRRLCVETFFDGVFRGFIAPAAFRRLCVETITAFRRHLNLSQPPSGGCVLKHQMGMHDAADSKPAAFRRLCVETNAPNLRRSSALQPPSGGCVLKQ